MGSELAFALSLMFFNNEGHTMGDQAGENYENWVVSEF